MGGFRHGRVIPPFRPFAVGFRGGGAVSSAAGASSPRRGVGGCPPPDVAAVAFAWWWFRVCPAGLGSGCAAARSRWAWSRLARPRRRVRGAVRACFFPFPFCRLGGAPWPLLFPLLLPPPCSVPSNFVLAVRLSAGGGPGGLLVAASPALFPAAPLGAGGFFQRSPPVANVPPAGLRRW
ncbi:MAG: hypothetical protein IPL59_17390 [Candidatus Competibacteraceae bacterium]|nr:hypothetical protein [Candidatus Competibacteraceae bacterium]